MKIILHDKTMHRITNLIARYMCFLSAHGADYIISAAALALHNTSRIECICSKYFHLPPLTLPKTQTQHCGGNAAFSHNIVSSDAPDVLGRVPWCCLTQMYCGVGFPTYLPGSWHPVKTTKIQKTDVEQNAVNGPLLFRVHTVITVWLCHTR